MVRQRRTLRLTQPADQGRGGPCARPDEGLKMAQCRREEFRFHGGVRIGTAPCGLQQYVIFSISNC